MGPILLVTSQFVKFSYAIFFSHPIKGPHKSVFFFFVDNNVQERMGGALLLIMVCMGTPSPRV